MGSDHQVLRVVVDTNILVSGILVRLGMPNTLLRLWQQDTFHLLTSLDLINEVHSTLHKERIRRKYHLEEEEIADIIENLRRAEQIIVFPTEQLSITSRDIKDNILLKTAFAGNAHFIVTGDEDLLVLKKNSMLGELQIVTVREFLSIIK